MKISCMCRSDTNTFTSKSVKATVKLSGRSHEGQGHTDSPAWQCQTVVTLCYVPVCLDCSDYGKKIVANTKGFAV